MCGGCARAEVKGWLNALKHRDSCTRSDCPCRSPLVEDAELEDPRLPQVEVISSPALEFQPLSFIESSKTSTASESLEDVPLRSLK